MSASTKEAQRDPHDELSSMDRVWLEVQAEIDYESRHPQEICTCGPHPSHCVKHGDSVQANSKGKA